VPPAATMTGRKLAFHFLLSAVMEMRDGMFVRVVRLDERVFLVNEASLLTA